jgi:phosphoglycolate phosphatase
METARAAGMLAIGALWGFRDRAELEAAGAAMVIEAPGELLAAIDPASRTQDHPRASGRNHLQRDPN